jgi:flagellin-like protein
MDPYAVGGAAKMKRGMSPLISTIILLGFAVALGGVVISWGESSSASEPRDCTRTSISLVELGGKPLLCDQGNRIQFTLENNGEVSLDGVKVAFLFSTGPFSTRVAKRIGIGDLAKLTSTYPSTFSGIQKVLFTPSFNLQGQSRLCPKQGFSVENIEAC